MCFFLFRNAILWRYKSMNNTFFMMRYEIFAVVLNVLFILCDKCIFILYNKCIN